MNLLDVHLLVGIAVVGLCAWIALGDGSDATLEAFPPTVRDNPASYKPSLTTMTGWEAPYVPVGGTGGGVYVGGGYSGGK